MTAGKLRRRRRVDAVEDAERRVRRAAAGAVADVAARLVELLVVERVAHADVEAQLVGEVERVVGEQRVGVVALAVAVDRARPGGEVDPADEREGQPGLEEGRIGRALDQRREQQAEIRRELAADEDAGVLAQLLVREERPDEIVELARRARVAHLLAERAELRRVAVVGGQIVDVGGREVGVEAGGVLPVAVGGDRGQRPRPELPVDLQRDAAVVDVLPVGAVGVGVARVRRRRVAVVAAERRDEVVGEVRRRRLARAGDDRDAAQLVAVRMVGDDPQLEIVGRRGQQLAADRCRSCGWCRSSPCAGRGRC